MNFTKRAGAIIVLITVYIMLSIRINAPACAEQPATQGQRFCVGERYGFRIDWFGIPVGYVTFEITGTQTINGRDCYVVTVKAGTNKFASKIYRIDDTSTSYVDAKKLVPLRYDVDRKEGNYRKRATTIYDRDERLAHFENFKDGSKKTYDVPDDVLDPVSSVLKARILDMDVGSYHIFNVDNNEEIYTIHAKIEKRDLITIKGFGGFQAFYVRPYAVTHGKREKRGTVSGYISGDDRRMLLYGECNAPLFTKMTATLEGKN
ncbi:MAG: DUF3108 domain-containing protein [Candidatus Omnitrophica bacterium]|nr:DUF3108 domain-containing protein [Candidatus Omnitrophota bacterium]